MPNNEPIGLNDWAKFSLRVEVASSPIEMMYGLAVVSKKANPKVRI